MQKCSKENQSLTAAWQEAMFLRYLLEYLGFIQNAPRSPTNIQGDNQSCIKIAENPVLARRSKHIETKHHIDHECWSLVRHLVKIEEIKLVYCSTENLAADLLAKPISRVKVQEHWTVILGRVDLEEECWDRSKIKGCITTLKCLPTSYPASLCYKIYNAVAKNVHTTQYWLC